MIDPVICRRRAIALAALALTIADLAMMAIAVARYPAFSSQPGADLVALEAVSVLAAYAVAAVWILRKRGPDWDVIVGNATVFGILGGTLEALNIGIENGIPLAIHFPPLLFGFMLLIVSSWAVAGYRTARTADSFRAGLLSAVLSSGLSMLIAVAVGFTIQFFFVPPEPASVSTWAELKRSEWTDPRALGLANTLDSGITHLGIAPIVALVFGGLSCALARSRSSKEASTLIVGRSGS
jgi:hypothetical protein